MPESPSILSYRSLTLDTVNLKQIKQTAENVKDLLLSVVEFYCFLRRQNNMYIGKMTHDPKLINTIEYFVRYHINLACDWTSLDLHFICEDVYTIKMDSKHATMTIFH